MYWVLMSMKSWYKFAVNDKGEIRFGLGAVKGVGHGPVKNIINVRKESGNFYFHL